MSKGTCYVFGLAFLVLFLLLFKSGACACSRDDVAFQSTETEVKKVDAKLAQLLRPDLSSEVAEHRIRLSHRSALVIHDEQGDVVPKATVMYRLLGSDPNVIQTDPNGRVELAQGKYVVKVSAALFQPLVAVVQIGDGECLLTLERSSSLVLEFKDDLGNFYPGIEAAIVPEGTLSGDTVNFTEILAAKGLLERLFGHEQLTEKLLVEAERTVKVFKNLCFLREGIPRDRCRSDELGRITWSEIPSASELRWCLLKRFPLKMNPAYEIPEVELRDGSFYSNEVSSGLLKLVSGPIHIRPGEQLVIPVTVLPQVSISGRIINPDGSVQPHAKLDLMERNLVMEGYESFRIEQQTESDQNGRFRFEQITLGEKLLEVTFSNWSEERNREDFYLAGRIVPKEKLSPGQNLDLGDICPQGLELELTIQLAESRSQELLSVGDVFDKPTAVALDLASTGVPVQEGFHHTVAVRYGTTVAFHGLNAGRYLLALHKPMSSGVRKGFSLPPAGLNPIRVSVPSSELITISVPVTKE